MSAIKKISKQKKWIIVLSICLTFILLSIYPIMLLVDIYSEGYYPMEITTEFNIKDTLENVDNEIAHVIFLTGQSNATGASYNSYLKQNVSVQKYEEYVRGYENVFINYINENGNTMSDGFVNTKIGQGFSSSNFGPELGLAENLYQTYPNEKFFIIKYAFAGSNLNKQWLSPSSMGPTGKLYTAFINFAKSNLNYLMSKGYNVKLDAMCWMQGESDAVSKKIAQKYEKYTKNLVKDVRADLTKFGGGNMLFVDAYIDSTYWKYYDIVNNAKLKVSKLSDNNVVIDTLYYGLTTKNEPFENPDTAHYDSMSELKLGHLFATEIIKKY